MTKISQRDRRYLDDGTTETPACLVKQTPNKGHWRQRNIEDESADTEEKEEEKFEKFEVRKRRRKLVVWRADVTTGKGRKIMKFL